MMGRHRLLACLVWLVTCWAPGVRGEEPPRSPAGDGENIRNLVRQLGSDTFAERESATAALERIGPPAIDSLRRVSAEHPDLEVRRRAAGLVDRIENSLDQLLADYRSYGLPLPPVHAPLARIVVTEESSVRFCARVGTVVTSTSPPVYALGFLVEPETKGRRAKLLYDTTTLDCEAKHLVALFDPKRLRLNDIEADLPDTDKVLRLAVQLHHGGWVGAKELLETVVKPKSELAPRKALRMMAWDYWEKSLLDPATDSWPAACRQMKTLLAGEPELDTQDHRDLLKSLEAALVQGEAKPGTVEALIDNLTKVRQVFGGYGTEFDEHYLRVLDLGFEAVPALLEHLDDIRLTHFRTRAKVGGGWSVPAHHYRVRDVIDLILRDLAGAIASRDWPDCRDDPATLKRRAAAWWSDARKQGEEGYLLAHVLPPSRPNNFDPESSFASLLGEWPQQAHLRLLQRKYPWRLPHLYREVLESRRTIQSAPLAAAIKGSSLSRNDKAALFSLATANTNVAHRRPALWELKDLDPDQFVARLIATLDDLPRAVAAPNWGRREAAFATLVCATDDPRPWEALERFARQAEVALRMELLDSVDRPGPTAVQRQRRLTFLSAFLDDDTVRDVTENEKFDHWGAGSHWPRLEVRNFAALRIAAFLGTPIDTSADWTDENWANLRDTVRARLKRELAKADAR